ncbi:hypothetical protein [Prescottella agglutinans]|nr:hypothetical protein [Prescottella agglutinans]
MRRILGLPDAQKLLNKDWLNDFFGKLKREEQSFRSLPPGICTDCGAHIVDWWAHHQFHESIVKAFEGHDRNMHKIVNHLRRM